MFHQIWFRSFLLIALGFGAYSFMLSAPFKTLDDRISIVDNKLLRDSRHIKDIFAQGYFHDHSYYRPLINLSFMGEYQLFGLTPFFYNLDNLLLHLVNTFLVWILIALLTSNLSTGFWVALIFVIHPIEVEAISNISGRAILLGASFAMTSFIFFLLYQQKRNWGYLFGSLISFGAALLCKESTAVLPGVMFCYLWLRQRPLKGVLPWGFMVGFYIIIRKSLGMTDTYAWRNMTEYVLGFATFLRSALTDIRLVFFPVDLHFDRSQRLFSAWNDPEFLMTVFVWAVIALWLWMSVRKIPPLIGFALAWITLEMLPVSQIVTTIGVGPGFISSAEHFLYLASVPVFLILVLTIEKVIQRNQNKQWLKPLYIQLALGGFLLFLIMTNIEQNIYASNELSMLERSLQMQPDNARIQFSVGAVYADRRRFPDAEKHFAQAVKGDMVNSRYQIALAQSLCDQGRYAECLNLYHQIKPSEPLKQLYENNKAAATRLLNQHVQILPK